MLFMDMIAEIRRRHLVSKESISSIARDLKLSRPTVRKHCRTQCEPVYQRHKQPTPMLGAFQETLAPNTKQAHPWQMARPLGRRLPVGDTTASYSRLSDKGERSVNGIPNGCPISKGPPLARRPLHQTNGLNTKRQAHHGGRGAPVEFGQ